MTMLPKAPANRNAARRRRAFTLLEVLVVVAIIALLISIMLPSLARAREEFRRVTCESNLKQIHLGWTTYLDTAGGWFPGGMNMEYNYGGLQGTGADSFGADPAFPVPKLINRNMNLAVVLREGGEVFQCPSDEGTSFVRPSAIRYYGTSYFPNHLLVGRNLWVPYSSPCKEVWEELAGDPWAWPPKPGLLATFNRSRIDNPAQLILIGDFAWLDTWDDTVPDEFPSWHGRKPVDNISFMDGHGASIRIRKGIHVEPRYSIIALKRIRERMLECQQEIKCP